MVAASSDRFSIRDYAAKMRIVDLGKSWPFTCEKEDRPLLPPISISKFRWWADELRVAGSVTDAKDAAVDETFKEPVDDNECQSPKSPPTPSTTKDYEFHLPKVKLRTPKKRLIAELFASAPKMMQATDQSNDDVEGKKVEEKVIMRKKKGKRRNEPIMNGNYALKKGKVYKPKMKSSVHSHLLQDSLHRRASPKTAHGVVNNKKFVKMKSLLQKHYSLQTSDQFKSVCQIFSDVLAATSVMNNSGMANELPDANDKPQTASTNEGNVDKTNKSSSQKNKLSDSSGEVNNGKLVRSSNSSCSIMGKTAMPTMIDLNHAAETANELDCFNHTQNLLTKCIDSGDTDFRGNAHKNGSSTSSEIGLPRLALASITPTEKSFTSVSNAAKSLTAMNNPSLIACNDQIDNQFGRYLNADMASYQSIPANQSGNYCHPKDLMSCNTCYSLGSNKCGGSLFLSNSMPPSKNTSTGEDFISLPLNTQELTQMHSGTKFVPVYKKHNMNLASGHDFQNNKQIENNIDMNLFKTLKEKAHDAALYEQYHSDWCQNHCHPTRENAYHGLNFTEFNDSERLDENDESINGGYEFLHFNENKTNFSFHDRKAGESAHGFFEEAEPQNRSNLACKFKPLVQPTMRLMGQTVVIGGSNRECPSSIMPEKYLSKPWTSPDFVASTTCGSSTGGLLKPSDSPSISYHLTEHNLIKNGVSGEISVGRRHLYYPSVASYQQNILPSATLCNLCQGASCSSIVIPQSPIQYHVHEIPCQQVLIQSPEKLPWWLLQAKYQKESQPFGFSRTNLTPNQAPYNLPTEPVSVNNISPTKTSAFVPNSSHSSLISVVTATNSIPEVTKSIFMKKKGKEGSHSKFTGSINAAYAHKYRTRADERDDILTKSAKRSYFDCPLLDYATASEVQRDANEMHSLSNTENSLLARLGRESVAGVKHVLNPSQKDENGNFRSVRSSTAFQSNPTSGKFSSTAEKTTKV